jgi:adenine-specific DNA-methyltransferase
MAKPPKSESKKSIETFTHAEAKRTNIPTAEHQSVMKKSEEQPLKVSYKRPEPSEPELIWRGKDEAAYTDLVVSAPPLYIQEKIHPKVLLENLRRESSERQAEKVETQQLGLFADFDGLPKDARATDFYQHQGNWTNRMILGDSLQVMASLSEREGLRGKVQCIYLDPPYGIKFNSNFQWSTTSRDVKDGNVEHITREPEQVKAFRDTWRDGIHSYLTYLRDRLTVAKELLTESGSIFVQMSEENIHRIRSLMDEIFCTENFCNLITYKTTSGLSSDFLATSKDYLLWYSKNRELAKFRRLFINKNAGEEGATQFTFLDSPDHSQYLSTNKLEEEEINNYITQGWSLMAHGDLTSTGSASTTKYDFEYCGKCFKLTSLSVRWKTPPIRMKRIINSSRLILIGKTPRFKRYLEDFPVYPLVDVWNDTGLSGFGEKKVYAVQTNTKVIERCILMTTDPGDLVLDPTCGSGTTAYVAEQSTVYTQVECKLEKGKNHQKED